MLTILYWILKQDSALRQSPWGWSWGVVSLRWSPGASSATSEAFLLNLEPGEPMQPPGGVILGS